MKGQNKKSERMKIILGSVAAALLLFLCFGSTAIWISTII